MIQCHIVHILYTFICHYKAAGIVLSVTFSFSNPNAHLLQIIHSEANVTKWAEMKDTVFGLNVWIGGLVDRTGDISCRVWMFGISLAAWELSSQVCWEWRCRLLVFMFKHMPRIYSAALNISRACHSRDFHQNVFSLFCGGMTHLFFSVTCCVEALCEML